MMSFFKRMNSSAMPPLQVNKVLFGGYWWLPLPILQNTILIAVNQPLADFCFVTQNQRGTKTGQNHGKIKSRTLRPKYPLWNTSVSFANLRFAAQFSKPKVYGAKLISLY